MKSYQAGASNWKDFTVFSFLKWIVGILVVLILAVVSLVLLGVIQISGGSNVSIVESASLSGGQDNYSYCGVTETFDEAVRCLNADDKVFAADEHRMVATAMQSLFENRLESAVADLAAFAEQTPYTERYEIVRDLLSSLLVATSDWDTISALASDTTASHYVGPSALGLAESFGDGPEPSVSFSRKQISMPLKSLRTGQPAIDVTIEGKEFRFLLDTGAGVHVIASDIAEKLGVSAGGEGVSAGTSTSQETQLGPAILPKLEIGDIIFENTPVAIINHRNLEFGFGPIKLVDIDGIIGWPFFAEFAVEFDYEKDVVTIARPEAKCVESDFFWYGYPVVRAETSDGIPLLFGLDTGAQGMSLYMHMVDRLNIPTTDKKETTVVGAGGAEKVSENQVEDMTIVLGGKELALEAPTASHSLLDLPVHLDGIISASGIGAQKIKIDFPNGCFEIVY